MSANLLGQSTSPYLLQHRDNPVHWQPWGPEALAQAKSSDLPILLSVGYAACHWCHVMAHESFENPDIAALMNEHFVNVKVDREERPDIDAIYMTALHMLGEQGGWPMTMFLTPDGEPFWGGTYFPPEPRWGRPSFPAVLREIARLYSEDRTVVDKNASSLRQRLKDLARPRDGEVLTVTDVDSAADALVSVMDPDNGGMRGAPKFPNCGVFSLLLNAGLRRQDKPFIESVTFTMERICEGGIYDHLAGGFARYSVDTRWLAPHFEKMLYDNAQIIDLLTTLWQVTRKPLFAARIAQTIAWLAHEMRLPDGGFASSLDADSEGEEGRFYVWSASEIEEILGANDFAVFASTYNVTRQGNWEGKTILNRLQAEHFSPITDQTLAPMRERLLAARAQRIRPGQDDKVLADWNGLTIRALARASAVFARIDWLRLATETFHFVTDSMSRGDQLLHAWRDGTANIDGLATDYANMAAAAITLHEVTSESSYLNYARSWNAVLDQHFTAESGGYFLSPESTDLIIRPLSASDEATPSANAAAAEVKLHLHLLTQEQSHAESLSSILRGFSEAAREQPFSHARLLAATQAATLAMQIAISGKGPDSESLWQAAWRTAAPGAIRLRVTNPIQLPSAFLLPNGAATQPDSPGAYVCANQTCSLRLTRTSDLVHEIETRRAD